MFDLAIRSVIPGCTLPGYCGGYYTRVRFHDGQCVYGSQRSYGPPSWRWFFATGKKMRVDESA